MNTEIVLKVFLLVSLAGFDRVRGTEIPGISEEETPLSAPATEFIRGMTLALLPSTYSDDDDWGAEKRVQSGLNVKVDKLKLRTSRRWKHVPHGIWRRADAYLVDPQKHFQLTIFALPGKEEGVPQYRIRASMRLRVKGRQQHWNLGVKLYSVSADAVADISLSAIVQFDSRLLKTDDGTKLRVLPVVDSADLALKGFRLNSVSHAQGAAVREFGRAFESTIVRAVRKKGEKLPAKINAKIQKKPERFEVPAGILSLFATKTDDSVRDTKTAKSDDTGTCNDASGSFGEFTPFQVDGL